MPDTPQPNPPPIPPDSDAPFAPEGLMSPVVVPEQAPAANPAPNPTSTPSPALGKALSRGTAWMVVSNVITKGASIVTFAIVAGRLEKADIGVWTMAFSFAAFTQFFRDGGVSQLLIQRGDKAYERLAGPVFWMALLFNLVTAGVLAGLAPLAAGPHFYNEPRLTLLLWIMAGTMPLMTSSTILWARLQTQLRFGTISKLSTISSLIRYGGTILFVLMGLGPLSFVLPLPIVVLYENVAYYAVVRDKPWARAPGTALWGELFRDSKWLVFVTFSYAAVNQGLFFVLGKMLTTADLGLFSTAYQMVTQIDQLLAATAAIVLYAALSRLNEEPARQRAATLRAARLMTLMSSIASFGLFATVGPVEQILWGGKWADAVLPAQIVAVAFAWRVLLWVPAPALQAQGKFRLSAVLVLLAGVGLTAAGAVGAKMALGTHGDSRAIAVSIAIGVAAFTAVGFLGFSLWGMRAVGVRAWDVLRQTVPTWLTVGVAGVAALAVHHYAHPAIVNLGVHVRLAAVADLALTGGVFVVLAYVLLRLFLRGILKEAAGLLPARLGFVLRFV